jgi:hypothetical protein
MTNNYHLIGYGVYVLYPGISMQTKWLRPCIQDGVERKDPVQREAKQGS